MYMAHVGDWNFWIFVRQMLENTFAYVYYTYWNSARIPGHVYGTCRKSTGTPAHKLEFHQHSSTTDDGVRPQFLDMCMANIGNAPELLNVHTTHTGSPLALLQVCTTHIRIPVYAHDNRWNSHGLLDCHEILHIVLYQTW